MRSSSRAGSRSSNDAGRYMVRRNISPAAAPAVGRWAARGPPTPCVPNVSRRLENLPTSWSPTSVGIGDMSKDDSQRRNAASGTVKVAPARILVVEDNPLNRLLVHDILELRGHAVVEAATV